MKNFSKWMTIPRFLCFSKNCSNTSSHSCSMMSHLKWYSNIAVGQRPQYSLDPSSTHVFDRWHPLMIWDDDLLKLNGLVSTMLSVTFQQELMQCWRIDDRQNFSKCYYYSKFSNFIRAYVECNLIFFIYCSIFFDKFILQYSESEW